MKKLKKTEKNIFRMLFTVNLWYETRQDFVINM